jgi:hypothetical protein
VKIPHPKPEKIGPYKVVYPIWKEDIAEALLIREDKKMKCECGKDIGFGSEECSHMFVAVFFMWICTMLVIIFK